MHNRVTDRKSKKQNRKVSSAVAVLAALFAAAYALLLGIGDFLFHFALNPRAGFTMKQFLKTGNTNHCSGTKTWYGKKKQPVSVVSDDGLTLHGWQISQDGHRYAILCHGYAGEPEQLAPYAAKFYEMGYSVLMPAAQAHGDSGGRYYGMGWPERNQLIRWAEELAAADESAEIVLFGISMGGATVMMAAGEPLPSQVKCIIEDCGYSSVWDEFAHQISRMFHVPAFPLLPIASRICRRRAGYGFREASAVEQLKKAKVPMLFIHGEKDAFVPYAMLNTVYGACASKEKRKLSVPDAAHANAADTNPELYWGSIEKFLRRYVT